MSSAASTASIGVATPKILRGFSSVEDAKRIPTTSPPGVTTAAPESPFSVKISNGWTSINNAPL
jgi:hypothetical protein